MEKKQYITPLQKVHGLHPTAVICGSGDPFGTVNFSTDIDTPPLSEEKKTFSTTTYDGLWGE